MQTQLFIGGRFVPAASGETLATLNPHDNSVIAEVAMAGHARRRPRGGRAKAAFPKWSKLAATERGRLLLKLADAIEANADELARLESLDTGHPIRDTRNLDVPRTAATFRYFGGMADKFEGSVIPVEPGFLNYLMREPVGVVGQIVPWNFPLMFTSWKMAPALAAGNCVVMKPAELTPLSSLAIAELMAEVGLSRGRRQHAAGAGSCGRPVHRRASGDQQGRLHGLDRGRPQDRPGVERQPEEGATRTRRQGREHRVRATRTSTPWCRAPRSRIFHNQGQACIAARG